jgi:hypothetical protein
MSKIKDEIIDTNGGVYDAYAEHEFHQAVDEQCSECHKFIKDNNK